MSRFSSLCSSPVSVSAVPSTRGTTPQLSLAASSPPAMSSPASSPGPSSFEVEQEENDDVVEDNDIEMRLRKLTSLIDKSAAYVSMLKEQMDAAKLGHARLRAAQASTEKHENDETIESTDTRKRKRGSGDAQEQDSKRAKVEDSGTQREFAQPALITGTTLKDYQLEGVAWMVGLYQNGISGILADEMGLGKTLQTIAFHAFLRERTPAPFLVVCPLSVLNNWVEEFHKFAPDIPVVMYHGTPQEREELRRTQMVFSDDDMMHQNRMFERYGGIRSSPAPIPKAKGKPTKADAKVAARKGKSTVTKRRASAEDDESDEEPVSRKGKSTDNRRKSSRFTGRSQRYAEPDEEEKPNARSDRAAKRDRSAKVSVSKDVTSSKADAGKEDEKPGPGKSVLPPHQRTNFPVVITTYEMIIKDRAQLMNYWWGFIVVDEGHRLKNIDCKLMREIKKLNASARMVLTGTPLHNNLEELWALLNFVLPDLFSDLGAFEEWFNLSDLQKSISAERSSKFIHSLHAILRPFLLRRLKADVEANLPPKKEYVLYAPLTERQRELYDAILKGGLRALLMKEAGEKGRNGQAPSADFVELADDSEDEDVPLRTKLQTSPPAGKKRTSARLSKRRNYAVDEDDDEYFAKLESGELDAHRQKEKEREVEQAGIEWQRKATLRKVNNLKLQNTVMQLRKVCSHPFLFDWPVDPVTRQPVLNEELISISGKMMLLDRLLEELFARKHKVLLFSQFTTMLDVIEDWAVEFKGWPICRIDGSTTMQQRREEVSRFQNGGDGPDAPRLFLLSTRAGGLGLNLVAADTVVFYDQDWNPQMDLQAQDRAHRIGQTKPVLIFRLISAHTIETKIMHRATEKRKLEALVIAKGQFKNPSMAANRNRPETMAEMAAALLRLEGEQIQVVPNTEAGKASIISDEELDMLLDRRPEVFTDRGKGWTSAGKTAASGKPAGTEGGESGPKTAFAVYEAPADASGDVLAGMLDEDEDS
ncbi:hypothetical protein WOLCODRAFT_133630, partial [Wolfiporia cocos MD-104 SS10]